MFTPDFYRRHLCPVASYVTLTSLVAWCLDIQHPVLRKLFPSLYIVPIILRVLGLPIGLLATATKCVNGFFVFVIMDYCLIRLFVIYRYLMEVWMLYSVIVAAAGRFSVIVMTIQRMLEPAVLGLYWVVLMMMQLWSNYYKVTKKNYILSETEWYIKVIVAMSEIVESPISLISFCTVVMASSNLSLDLTRRFLLSCGGTVGHGNPVLQSGLTEGIVTFILALQTGLIDIEMPARIGALSIILFIVVASLLQSVYELTHPVLLALCAVNRRPANHVKVLSLTLFLLAAPSYMTLTILTKVSSDMWTLVVISSCVVTIVQVLGTLVNYFLFLWDSFQTSPSDNMDDYVYYIKSVTRGIEFLLAVAIVGGGFYEAATTKEELSMLNSVILVIHCYFNIYTRLTAGWRSYLQRREALKRMATLADATEEQLKDNDDVCSICFEAMAAAKVTSCRHYFHGACLRRWLYIQDNCPMCTAPIVKTVVEKEEERGEVRREEEEDHIDTDLDEPEQVVEGEVRREEEE